MYSVVLILTLICLVNGRILPIKPDYIASSEKHQESTLYSCFINNAETDVIIHEVRPQYLNKNNMESLHKEISLSISTFSCYQYHHIIFTFSLKLFTNLYHKNGGIKIFKDGKISDKPNIKKKYTSFLGDVAIFEYTKDLFSNKAKEGRVSLTFLGDLSIFDDIETEQDVVDIYKCLSFSAKIWTEDMFYEIEPIPTSLQSSSPICNTLVVSAIPSTNLDSFSQSTLNHIIMKQKYKQQSVNNNNRDLLQDFKINIFDCPSFSDQWDHQYSVQLGLLIDRGMYNEFDNSDERLMEFISTIIANVNGIYEQQINIHVSIGTVFISDDAPNFYWNDAPPDGQEWGCSIQTSGTQFGYLKTWNRYYWNHTEFTCYANGYSTLEECPTADNNAVWILLSKCLKQSGVATTRTLCDSSAANSAVVNWAYSQTWLIFAHELGHIFGARHSFENGSCNTGGIMDYCDNRYYDGVYQFNNYRFDDICNGLDDALNNGRVPNCFSINDYGGTINYHWRQTGSYLDCYPLCGDYQYTVETSECVMTDENGVISQVVDDSECGLAIKPQGKFRICEEERGDNINVCPAPVCGNGLWETDEECDTLLLRDKDQLYSCCDTDCKRSKSTECQKNKIKVDAAFTDSNDKLYIFQGSQYSIYSNKDDLSSPDDGYPKLISHLFPIEEWSGDFDAAFCTPDDIVYIFKDWKYIKIDLDALYLHNAQLSETSNAMLRRNQNFELGVIPREWYACGHIDAAWVHSIDQVSLLCESQYYTWSIGSNGVDDLYRPFWADYDITFSSHLSLYFKIDAASYDYKTNTIRFYSGDRYIDYSNGIHDSPKQLNPMGYWLDSASSNNCILDHCMDCPVYDDFICFKCEEGYTLHNSKCYDSDYLVIMEFESIEQDATYYDSSQFGSIYVANGGVFSETNAVKFTSSTQIPLYKPNTDYTVIKNWRISMWLYPTDYIENQYILNIVNTDTSVLAFKLNTNSKCDDENVLTVIVEHTDEGGEMSTIYQDDLCRFALTINEWSKVTFKANEYQITATVNSKVDSSPVVESNFDLTIDINSWYLGKGYIGKMDYFIFQVTDGFIEGAQPITPTPTAPGTASACVFPWANVLAIGAVGLAAYTALLWIVYRYWGAALLLNSVVRQLNYEQQQQQEIEQDDQDGEFEAGAGQVEMVVNNNLERQERAAGIAIKAIHEALSGNVTPDIRSPANPRKQPLMQNNIDNGFLSPKRLPKRSRYQSQSDGNLLASPVVKSPYRFVVSPAKKK